MDLLRNPPPNHFDPFLTSDNLKYFADQMLSVYSNTIKDLCSIDDDNYTISCAVFGRCKNRFTRLILSGETPVDTQIQDSSNNFTFRIGNTVGIRFFKEIDYLKPKRPNFFKQSENLDMFEVDASVPSYWRFILVPASSDEEETFVAFVGFNSKTLPITCWTSNNAKHFIFDPQAVLPAPAELKGINIDDLLGDQDIDKVKNF